MQKVGIELWVCHNFVYSIFLLLFFYVFYFCVNNTQSVFRLKTYFMVPLFAWCTPVVVCVNEQGTSTKRCKGMELSTSAPLSKHIHSRSRHAWVVVIGCCMVWAQMTKYGPCE